MLYLTGISFMLVLIIVVQKLRGTPKSNDKNMTI